ncbi:MAG TPA: hypothetical protein VM638_03645 [Actinomycetota bacterium]|nr:hypothetical protein [Actinomycetota bacterium]
MRKLPIQLAVAALAVALVAPAATAEPEIAITTPADGSTISRSTTSSILVSGNSLFEEPQQSNARFFLRRAGCGTANDNQRLSRTSGTDNSGCAYTASITPLNELDGGSLADSYPAADGVPLTLDATKPISGVIQVSSYQPGVNAGVGMTRIDITLRGSERAGGETQIGTTSVSYTVLPGQAPVRSSWSFQPVASLDKKDFTSLELSVVVRGHNVMHGFTNYGGSSYLDIPSWTKSFDRRVEIAVDNGAFSSTGVTYNAERTTWSRNLTTPSAGPHVIKARAVQGSVVSAVDQVAIQVVS